MVRLMPPPIQSDGIMSLSLGGRSRSGTETQLSCSTCISQ
jgi:hypothetical protein